MIDEFTGNAIQNELQSMHCSSLQFRRIEHGVFHSFPLPSVSDVDFAVAGLDDGGVGIFARCALEDEDRFPRFAIRGDGDVEHVAAGWENDAARGVVIHDELATVLEGDGVGAGVRVRQW